MRLRARLLVAIAVAAAVPVAVSGWLTLRIHQRAFDAQLDARQREIATQAAARATARVESAARAFALLGDQIDWEQLSTAERQGALWLAYRQEDDAILVSLLDDRGQVLDAAWSTEERREPGHLFASTGVRARFAGAVPVAAAGQKWRLGRPFRDPASPSGVVPLAIATTTGRTLAIALSLRGVCDDLQRSTELDLALFSDDGQPLCDRGPSAIDPRLRNAPDGLATYRDRQGVEQRAALAGLPHGFHVVAQQPLAVASAPGRTIRATALGWLAVGLIIAIALALVVARTITRSVRRLVERARQIGRGEFAPGAPVTSTDELGELARAFDTMGDELGRREQTIRGWNDALKERVEERTRELRGVQEQLLRSQKVAAMGSLAAGFAHEINNPLTTVLGMAQLLQRRCEREQRAQDAELLGAVTREAERIKMIVSNLLVLSADYAGKGYTEVDATRLLDDVVASAREAIGARGIAVERSDDPDLPRMQARAGDLREAMLQIVRNAVNAMGPGGRLSLRAHAVEGHALRISIADTGRGIEPGHLDKIFDPFFTTKREWSGAGLGLTVAHRIVEQHHGRIDVASTVGLGTTMTITLPVARPAPHLS